MSAELGIAFAGIILSALLGYLNYRANREARDAANQQARETREAAAREARAGRLFDGRKNVYEEVLEYAYRIEDTVDRTEPLFTWDGMPKPPEWPTEDEVRRQNSRTALWGSPELRDKLMELKKATSDFQGATFVLVSHRTAYGQHSDEAIKQWQEAQTKREAVKALVKEVIEMANAELRR